MSPTDKTAATNITMTSIEKLESNSVKEMMSTATDKNEDNSTPKAKLKGERKLLMNQYEFMLNDSPLADDRFIYDGSWVLDKELEECDLSGVKINPFNLYGSSTNEQNKISINQPNTQMIKRKRSSLLEEPLFQTHNNSN
jgi:hypothetical protein